MNELINFEKCVINELGSEMVNQLKNHYAFTYGQLKPAIDYMFANFYAPKSAKLVLLNLKIDNIKSSSDDPVKARNLELKNKLNNLKAAVDREESESSLLIQDIRNAQHKLNKSKNDLLNKQLNGLLQEKAIAKALDISTSIKNSEDKLNFISEPKFKNDLLEKNDCNESENSEVNEELDDFFKTAGSQSAKDLDEIEKITDSFENELELILYRIDSSNQLFDMNSTEKNLSVFDQINELYFEFIQKNCQKIKFNKDTESNLKQINETKQKLNVFFKKTYPKDSMVYGQYLKSYLMLKSTESNLNELKCFLQTFQKEISCLSQISTLTEEKQMQLNNLDDNIHVKQLEAYNIFDDNIRLITKHIPSNMLQIRSFTDSLIDVIHAFSASYLGNLKRLDEITFGFNNSPTKSVFVQRYTPKDTIQVYKQKEKNVIDENLMLQQSLFSREELSNQRLVFEKFISIYREIKIKLSELDKSIRNSIRIPHVKQLINEIRTCLNNCKHVEQTQLLPFVESFEQESQRLSKFNQELNQLETQIEIWVKQPGAYECILDEITHNGKRLDYFVNLIEEAIADNERNKMLNIHI